MPTKNFSIGTTLVTAGHCQILIEGEATIQSAELIKYELLQQLNTSKSITLILENLTKIDVSVLQLMVAFYKSCVDRKLSVSFNFTRLAEPMMHTIMNSGFAEIFRTSFEHRSLNESS